jgi:hypothetical protein
MLFCFVFVVLVVAVLGLAGVESVRSELQSSCIHNSTFYKDKAHFGVLAKKTTLCTLSLKVSRSFWRCYQPSSSGHLQSIGFAIS